MHVAQVSGEEDETARENEDRDRRILRRNRSKAENFHVEERAAQARPEVIRDAMLWMKTGMLVLGGDLN